ncbi:ribonuclease H-like domain-containing protein [Planococcus sp. APC 3900]|uniref:ribonuclease H-like domain-containing protein n=1 Tax=Planococcus sp. APC 3900 TaxID=3035191 RepID=UPI0025B58324|nr:ribonuclease H-like domain-containing protein [Planococcus sp. APC 3900]MDN3438843.1 ribonuclease H-like domain-containing protein [Planococcus sp. APC 3900]
MSFENKLLQMKGMLKKQPAKKQQPKAVERPLHEDKWNKIGLELVENKFGFVYRKKIVYPLDTHHGSVVLNELDPVLKAWENVDFDHPFKLSEQDPLVFFDTETTGLSGTGAYIFLIGLLVKRSDHFEMMQYIMPDPSHEAAFLYETGLWKNEDPIIFSYNGKSFDWPQLTSRWTMHRQILPKLPVPRQIDLFHGTKRIWKNELARMKLSTIEEEKLGFMRQGDVPGYLIPAIYLDAVKSGFPEGLAKVLYHNELDILSLVSLYVLSSNLLMEDMESETSGAYTNIGKWYADLKQFDQSAAYLEHVTAERGASSALARYLLAIQKKRAGHHEEAVKLFKEAAPHLRGSIEVEAWIHAAKLYEHQLHNLDQALIMAGFAKEASEHTKVRQSLISDIHKRITRLEEKKRKKRPELDEN